MEPSPPRPRRKRHPTGYAIGAFVVEIDQRLLRGLPPVEELVAKGDPIRGLSGEPGTFDLGPISVVFPPADEPARLASKAPSGAGDDPEPGDEAPGADPAPPDDPAPGGTAVP